MTSPSPDRPTHERQAAIDAFNVAVEELEADASTMAIARLLVRLPCACLVKGKNARITYASPEYRQLFDSTQPVGCIEHELLPPDLQAICNSTDDVVLRRGRTIAYICNVSNEGVADRYFRTEKTALLKRGEIVGVASFTTEIAEAEFVVVAKPEVSSVSRPSVREEFGALDPRECELARLLSRGAINKNLATHFDVSVRSIENWRRALLTKLGIENIPELTRWVVRAEDLGLLPRE